MSKQAFKRVRKAVGLEVTRKPLDSYAWPGGYPLYYVFLDGGVICSTCVNENIEDIDQAIKGRGNCNSHGGWAIDGVDVNYEDSSLYCDHCSKRIESAYAEEEVPEVLQKQIEELEKEQTELMGEWKGESLLTTPPEFVKWEKQYGGYLDGLREKLAKLLKKMESEE